MFKIQAVAGGSKFQLTLQDCADAEVELCAWCSSEVVGGLGVVLTSCTNATVFTKA